MRSLVAALLIVAAGPQGEAPVAWTGTPTQGGVLIGTVAPDVTALTLRSAGRADVAATLDTGRFMIGLDRDAPADEALVATLRGGGEQVVPLPVAPRAWRIEQVDADFHAGTPDAAFAAIRPGELMRIAAARAGVSTLIGWQTPLRWPAAGRISGLFGAQRVYRGKPGSYHGGVDIAAPAGTSVTAPAAGRVVLAAAAPFTLEGRLLIVDHGGGLFSAFLHLSRIDVREGEAVAAGQALGAVGMTGRATGPHLHWALSWRDARLDPLLVAGPPRP